MSRVCIDFLGIPGCGKSTIAHLLAKKLSTQGDVKEPTYYVAHRASTIVRLCMKIYGCLSLMICYPKCFFRLTTIVKDSGSCIYSLMLYKHIYNIAFKIKEMKNIKCNYMILDEGLWQSAVSLYYNQTCSYDDIVRLHTRLLSLVSSRLKKMNIEYMSVLVNVSIEEAMRRQMSRNAKPSRVQSLEEEKRIIELKNQRALFEHANANFVVDSTDVRPLDNAIMLYHKIVNDNE